MGDVVYRAQVQVDRGAGSLRYATVSAEGAPAVFGVHGEVAVQLGGGRASMSRTRPRWTTSSRRRLVE